MVRDVKKEKNPSTSRQHFVNLKSNFKSFLREIYILILGKHPNNTFLSFNFHNVRHIIKYLKKERDKIYTGDQCVLVDIGAGSSPYYDIFSPVTSRYIAVDLMESLPETENRSIEQIYGLAEVIPLENSTADIVLFNQCLEHVQDPLKSVTEIYRILKSGGKLIGSVPHISPVHLEPNDFRRYTDLGLRQLLESAGYTDINIEGSGGVYSATALLIMMDWMLTPRKDSIPQGFSGRKALLISPIVGMINGLTLLLDFLTKDKHRSPANLCWSASKPHQE
jgi:SAM-dependent methyltransferase